MVGFLVVVAEAESIRAEGAFHCWRSRRLSEQVVFPQVFLTQWFANGVSEPEEEKVVATRIHG
jgi:hypothetical protein